MGGESNGDVPVTEEKFVKVLHAFATRIGSTLDTATKSTKQIKSLLNVPSLQQEASSSKAERESNPSVALRDPRTSAVLEVLQQATYLSGELTFILNALESRQSTRTNITTETGQHPFQNIATAANSTPNISPPVPPEHPMDNRQPSFRGDIVENKSKSKLSISKDYEACLPYSTRVESQHSTKSVTTNELQPQAWSPRDIVHPVTSNEPISSKIVRTQSEEVADTHTPLGVKHEDFSDDSEGEDTAHKPKPPPRAKVAIKDILSRIDSEIAQEKTKSKHNHHAKTPPSPVPPPQSLNTPALKSQSQPVTSYTPVIKERGGGNTLPTTTFSPTSRTNHRIVVGQRQPDVHMAKLSQDNDTKPISKDPEKQQLDSAKKQQHIEKLSDFFQGRPTSMELYNRNILKEPGHDVLYKVQRFDAIGKHPYSSISK